MTRYRDLWCRNGRWYFRKRFPKDVREALGKEHFIQALRTSDREAALRKRPLVEIEYNASIDRSRRSVTPDNQSVSEEELIGIVQRWFREAAENQVPAVKRGELDDRLDDLSVLESDYRESLSEGNFSPVHHVARQLLEDAKIELSETSDAYLSLCRSLMRGLIESLKIERARLTGDYTYRPADPLFRESVTSFPTGSGRDMTFGQLIDTYQAEKEDTWALKTRLDYQGRLGTLREIVGGNRKLATIDRAMCREVREVVIALPPNHTKLDETKDLSAPKAAEYAKIKRLPGLKPKTANTYLNLLSAMLRWAVREEYVDRNPAEGLSIADDVAKRDKRQPFTIDQLKAIFIAPLYTGCKDDGAGYNQEGPNVIRKGRFWVPLVALWTGMRLSEICQLHVADIGNVDGVDCIKINADGEGKSLKTKASNRLVPIHPELVKIGFMGYVARLREAGQTRLFPDLKRGRRGDPWGPMSQWFRRFLTTAGVKSVQTSFHSFRHTFRDALREADVSQERVRLLGGWRGGGGIEDDYGNARLARALYEEIKKVRYPGLDLSHLH